MVIIIFYFDICINFNNNLNDKEMITSHLMRVITSFMIKICDFYDATFML